MVIFQSYYILQDKLNPHQSKNQKQKVLSKSHSICMTSSIRCGHLLNEIENS